MCHEISTNAKEGPKNGEGREDTAVALTLKTFAPTTLP